jgi:4-aminobutyrate aminotransferase
MAALIARAELDVAADTSLGHFTHEKSPVGAAAGLAALDVLERDGLVERAAQLGESFVKELHELAGRFACLGEIRHIGMLFSLDVVRPDQAELSWPAGAEIILYEALAHGLSFKVSNGSVLTLAPPLILEPAQWQEACHILAEAIEVALATYELEKGAEHD